MSRDCDCCGNAGRAPDAASAEITRRGFLHTLGIGALALYGVGQAVALAADEPVAPSEGAAQAAAYPLTPPRVYAGERLGAVAMPIGGIGTGTIWLDGQGRQRVWQIFNNSNEPLIPGSFLGLRVRVAGGAPQLRALQTEPEPGFPACPSLTFEGGYPVARLDFDTGLPVSARLEAFNPLIPTDTANSSLPCVIYRVTVRNEGAAAAQVALLSTLQNAVGYDGQGEAFGVTHPSYGGNANASVAEDGLRAVQMTTPSEPPWTGFLRVRNRAGRQVGAPPLLWLGSLSGPAQIAAGGSAALGGIDGLSRIAGQRAVIVASGCTEDFLSALRLAADEHLQDEHLQVFEDFEGATYEGWTVEGDGFGAGPSPGTHPDQQAVSGFVGRGMVNTFLPNDGPQGRLASKPFTLTRRYIGFLIGGGGHANETCMNLWVDGRIVRTATGRNVELLEPHAWDVGEFAGKQGFLEIVDRHSGGWGHINIDQIVFSDVKPDTFLRLCGAFGRLARQLPIRYTGVSTVRLPQARAVAAEPALDMPDAWRVGAYVRIEGLECDEGEAVVLARMPNGDPVLLQIPYGQATLVLSLAQDMPWSWARMLICRLSGLDADRVSFETTRPGWGSMTLATPEQAAVLPAWTDGEALAREFLANPALSGIASAPSEAGRTWNGALAVPFELAPGQERTVSFVVTWHFPNVERFGHEGNHYCEVHPDSLAAARYVVQHLDRLTQRTFLYQRTVYESNLPEEFLDAMTSQSVILRGPTCWRSAEGYFGGYEGAYGCCPLNCTHVWNYAQTHARLFPEIARNIRVSDFITYLHESGETSHRQHAPSGAFADGHCACIAAALREHQMSRDDRFLRRIWPSVRKAMDWFIGRYDTAGEGVTRTQQWNTYDTAVSGLNTFIGSQYLSALQAAVQMAGIMGETEVGERWSALLDAGRSKQDAELWGGSYYVQRPETPPAHDYNNGCHSDQLLGQWWAHQLGGAYLYPPDRVRQACESIFEHNFRPDFTGLPQIPRRYIDDGDGGLYMCTWPNDDRPDPFTLYSVEVWTGVEYSTAGLMVHEGLLEDARTIVRAARSRYDGRPRKDQNSGGGVCGMGNPFQELECGKFYARAMSSWGLLIACQGLTLDGPAGHIGFAPKWQPEDHRSFFTAPEGWGLFIQRRDGQSRQTERLELRHGSLQLTRLAFETGFAPGACTVTRNGRAVAADLGSADDGQAHVTLAQALLMKEGDVLEVVFARA